MILSENREFYDLCRKYMYFYKAYNEMKKVNEKYWTKSINYAYEDIELKLEYIEKQIMNCLFSLIIPEDAKIEIEADVVCDFFDIGVRFPKVEKRTIVHSSDFSNCIEEYLNNAM
jgi:hypothetical protein